MPRRQPPTNPFRYGALAAGPFFADREDELAVLSADLRGGQDVVIISPRRMGKTSLVERAIEELRREGMLVAYLDLLGSPTKEQLADHLAQALYEGLVSPLERALERVRDFFSHLTIAPRLTIGDDGKPVFEFLGYDREEDVDHVLEGLLGLPARVAQERSRRVALVLDEFQEVLAIDEHLPGLLRSVFQRQPDVAHVYLGSKRHLMEPLFMERAAPLYRSAKPLLLGPIAPAVFEGFLRERFAAGRVAVDEAALAAVLELTGGLPYETQELCSFAWTRARLHDRRVDEELLAQALSDLLDAESARYLAVWDRLSAQQRSLLLALAREPGRVYAQGYRRRHKLGAASSVQGALQALQRLDLVEAREHGGHAISDIFLRVWLRQLDQRSSSL